MSMEFVALGGGSPAFEVTAFVPEREEREWVLRLALGGMRASSG